MYGVGNYFWSKTIVDLPYLLFFPLLYGVIIYWFVGLSNTIQQFFTFYLILFLNYLMGSSIGLLISSSVKDPKYVSLLINTTLLPFLIFAGFAKNR